MAKDSDLMQKVCDYILDEMKRFHELKEKKAITVSDIPIFKTKTDILSYVYNSNLFCESDNDRNDDGKKVPVSEATIHRAINTLLDEHLIQKTENGYEYAFSTYDKKRENFPFLKIASSIPVTVGVPECSLFLSVDEKYVDALTEYLRGVFYKGDILFLPHRQGIECIQLGSPAFYAGEEYLKGIKEDSDLTEKKAQLLRRIVCVLQCDFDVQMPEFKFETLYETHYLLSYEKDTPELKQQIIESLLNKKIISSKKQLDTYNSLMEKVARAEWETEKIMYTKEELEILINIRNSEEEEMRLEDESEWFLDDESEMYLEDEIID